MGHGKASVRPAPLDRRLDSSVGRRLFDGAAASGQLASRRASPPGNAGVPVGAR